MKRLRKAREEYDKATASMEKACEAEIERLVRKEFKRGVVDEFTKCMGSHFWAKEGEVLPNFHVKAVDDIIMEFHELRLDANAVVMRAGWDNIYHW